MKLKHILSVTLASILSLVSMGVSAVTIAFPDPAPNDTTHIGDGLLLNSSNGGYSIGGCGAGAVGCLGGASSNFGAILTFTFVETGTTNQAATDMVELLMCRACVNRNSTADVFDPTGALLATLDLNATISLDVPDHTFSFAAPSIGRVEVDLGGNGPNSGSDGVESITFGAITPIDGNGDGNGDGDVPEPSTVLLLGLGMATLTAVRRRRFI